MLKVYIYSLVVSGIALLFNPRQELFPKGWIKKLLEKIDMM